MWARIVVWGVVVLLLPFGGVKQQDKKIDRQNQRLCADDSECASGACIRGVCEVLRCENGLRDGKEILIDCGGPACRPCSLWDHCGLGSAKLVHAVWLLPNLYYRYYYGRLAAKYPDEGGGLNVSLCAEMSGPVNKNRCFYLDFLYDRFRACDHQEVNRILDQIDEYEVMFF